MAFVKGKSGNPLGRPKAVTPDGRTIAQIAREYTDVAIKTLVDVAKAGESEAARVAASNALLDRAWGRPAQAVELTGVDGGPVQVIDPSRLSDADLEAMTRVAKLVHGNAGD